MKSKKPVENDRGSIAVVMALVLPMMLAVAGTALDYSMGVKAKSQMQKALDAAVLAASVSGDGADVRALVASTYASNTTYGSTSKVVPTSTATGRTISATASADHPTYFMSMFGRKSMHLTVASSAAAPITLRTVKFEATNAGGWWEKTVRLMVIRSGSSTPEELVNVHYQPLGPTGPDGPMTVTPTGVIDLGTFTSAYLEFTIGPMAYKFTEYCGPQCPTVLRSNDPETSDRFTIDGKVVERGRIVDIFEWAKCGQVSKQDWEDGGGDTPDIHYTIEATCGVSPGTARVSN